MPSTMSEHTIEVLREIFSRNGLSEILVSNNRPQITSDKFHAFMDLNGIRHSKPSHIWRDYHLLMQIDELQQLCSRSWFV